jgi:phenylalanyl-tRNA synthetase beta chain
MKISMRWLQDHIDVADYMSKPQELAKILTAAGLEVESVEDRSLAFKNVVVGQVVKLDKHPNADRLTVCQVDAGEGSTRQIVCGAKNHKQGDKVVVTLPGAVLPGNFEIKKSKIRDVESLGMLASESELGLKKESEGILILPADAPVGKPFAEYFGLDDVLIEINVTVNRADCLSHLGLARELSCLLDRPLKTAKLEPKLTPAANMDKAFKVQLKDSGLCPRYSGRVINDIKVGPSPEWLKRRLESVGLNSINNVVDVTNFVMMDTGQPLHAFDIDKLENKTIVVDKAQVGEKFKTLDGTGLTLTGDELTIRDQSRAVCIAGAIGGQNSGVGESTRHVFVESAHFAMDSVRKTARRHGLQTDSAYRFSRGTDPSGVVRALERACALIQQVAGGSVADYLWDEYPGKKEKPAITVRPEYIAQRLGYPLEAAKVELWLKRLGCQVSKSGSELKVVAPEFRVDLEQEVDYVEEMGRLEGYDHIPENLPNLSYAPLDYDKSFTFEQRVSELARAAGLSQCVNYGFVGSKYQAALLGSVETFRGSGLDMDSEPIRLKNPLSEDLDVMRVSLVPGLLKNVLHNYRHGNTQGLLFEIGYVFRHGPEGYMQEPRLSVVAWGKPEGLWSGKDIGESYAFYDLKSRVQQILEKMLINQPQWNTWGATPQLIHPAQAATLFVEGRNVGFLGSAHPQWLMNEKVRTGVAIGEFDLKALSRGQPRSVKFKPVSKFPAVERDLAFLLPKTMRAADVAQEIKKTAGPILQSLEIFDTFSGESVPEGFVSVAYRMVYQDLEGTLGEERLTALQKQIVANVEKKLAVKVR